MVSFVQTYKITLADPFLARCALFVWLDGIHLLVLAFASIVQLKLTGQ